MFIIIVFRLGNEWLARLLFILSFPGGAVTGCDSSLGGGTMIFNFRLFKFILFFVNWISLCFFPSFILCWYVTFIIVFDLVLTRSSSVSRRISAILSLGISYGMWLLAWEFLLFSSVLPFADASSFLLLLLRLCSNRCVEALVAYRNSLLNGLLYC